MSIPFSKLPWCKCSLRINFDTLCSSNAACTLKHFKLNSTQQAKQVKAGYLAVLSSSKVHFMHFTRNFACKNITNSCLVIPFSCLWPITIGRKSLKKMANKGCAESSQIVTILTYIYKYASHKKDDIRRSIWALCNNGMKSLFKAAFAFYMKYFLKYLEDTLEAQRAH